MFTGIIQAVGQVAEMQTSGGDLRLRVNTGKLSLDDVAPQRRFGRGGSFQVDLLARVQFFQGRPGERFPPPWP